MSTLSLHLNLTNNYQMRTIHRAHYPSNRIFKIAIIISIITFISIYLSQINHVVRNLYEISQLENQISQLSSKNQQIELSLANSHQLTNFSQLAQKFNFEKVNKIYYIREDGSKIVER